MPTPKEEVDIMLEDCSYRKPGMIERNEKLAKAIEHFMDLKRAIDPRVEHVTLAWFYEKKLRPKFDGPKKIETVKIFVREILKCDPQTGKAL